MIYDGVMQYYHFQHQYVRKHGQVVEEDGRSGFQQYRSMVDPGVQVSPSGFAPKQ